MSSSSKRPRKGRKEVFADIKVNFRKLDEKHGNYSYYYCNYCEADALENGTMLHKTIGRFESFEAHSKVCRFKPTEKIISSKNTSSSSISTSSSNFVSSNSLVNRVLITQRLTPYLDQGFSKEQVITFENLYAEYVADNGISFHSVERKSTQRLFGFVRKTAADNLPCRKRLST